MDWVTYQEIKDSGKMRLLEIYLMNIEKTTWSVGHFYNINKDGG